MEEVPCQGRAGEGWCCVQRAAAGAARQVSLAASLGRLPFPTTASPAGRQRLLQHARCWEAQLVGAPPPSAASLQAPLPGHGPRPRLPAPPCLRLALGRVPGPSPSPGLRGTRETASRPDARVAPGPGGTTPPCRRQTRLLPLPRPPWGEGRGRRSPWRIIMLVPNIPNSCSFRLGRKPGRGGGRRWRAGWVRRPVVGPFGVNLSPFAACFARGSGFPVRSLGVRVGGHALLGQGCAPPQEASPKSRGSRTPSKRADGGAEREPEMHPQHGVSVWGPAPSESGSE